MLVKKIVAVACLFYLNTNCKAQPGHSEIEKVLIPKPVFTEGVKQVRILLNGTWEINQNPSGQDWKNNGGTWKKIQVPGEPAMQGYKIVNDKEFLYRTVFTPADDLVGKTVKLRFNGVYSYARVYINGEAVGEHYGGFTSWDIDISRFLKKGEPVKLVVGVTDRSDDISYASGYAHHPIGGILRDVELIVLPNQHISDLHVQTILKDKYKKAELLVKCAVNGQLPGGKIELNLLDPSGKQVWVQDKYSMDINSKLEQVISIPVDNPLLWNEETPNRYKLRLILKEGGRVREIVEQAVGFREVKLDGKRLLVNGDPVKLRGACRHDMHPTLGRTTNRYYDSLDLMLAKEANINFIRTSHYPPSKDFLELADSIGMYIQEETAICFVNDWRTGVYNSKGETQNDPYFTDRYLSQLKEMIQRDRNHAAVIMWSIGNESVYGTNFQKEYEYVKQVEPNRPVSWSFPGNALRQNKKCFDIAVAHYPAYDGKDTENFGLTYKNMEHESMPLLSDEWAHVACYNTTLLTLDPGVKDFWGRSLDTMWMNRFDIPGNLGGAIWGMTDEVFALPDTVTGYGPWGIMDTWRRKKAEFWNTKKAHSPVKVLQSSFTVTSGQRKISIPVKNRFNHLNLSAITVEVKQGTHSFKTTLPSLKPHEEGTWELPIKNTQPLLVRFYHGTQLLDEERIECQAASFAKPQSGTGMQWTINEADQEYFLKQGLLEIRVSKASGHLVKASRASRDVLNGGIRIVLNRPRDAGAFKNTDAIFSGSFNAVAEPVFKKAADCFSVVTQGKIDTFRVELTTHYFADGRIETDYTIQNPPAYSWQIGVAFPLSDSIDAYDWKRKGYWSVYPPGHMGATEGTAFKKSAIGESYRKQPAYEAALAEHDYYISGAILPDNAHMGTSELYRASKENLDFMKLRAGKQPLLQVFGNGVQAGKINWLANQQQELLVADKLDFWSLSWGNYAGTKNVTSSHKGKVIVQLLK
jgi:hypothetical protein